jgi:anti-sigma regulatory factor (Ser/Thr protein kinase)
VAQQPSAASTQLSNDPAGVRAARQFVAGTLRGWGLDGTAEVVVLLTSELVSNAVVHATGSPVGLVIMLDDHGVRVEVHDGNREQPTLRQGNRDREQGRGLALVAALAASWGVQATSTGKSVWFQIRTRSDGR